MFLVSSLRFEIKEAGVAFLKNLYPNVCVCVREREREREGEFLHFIVSCIVALEWSNCLQYYVICEDAWTP